MTDLQKTLQSDWRIWIPVFLWLAGGSVSLVNAHFENKKALSAIQIELSTLAKDFEVALPEMAARTSNLATETAAEQLRQWARINALEEVVASGVATELATQARVEALTAAVGDLRADVRTNNSLLRDVLSRGRFE